MIIKQRVIIAAVIVFVTCWSLWTISYVYAGPNTQSSIDSFQFFIPYPADQLDDQFDVGHAAIDLQNAEIVTTISIAVRRGGSQIYYDHWEDGLEADHLAPTQPSTEIWGDNNPANGIPPNFLTDTLANDDVIVLQNVIPLPRDPATLFFDGGDAITAFDSSVAITRVAWPLGPSTLYAGAWELYPTSRWGTRYQIPVGENLVPPATPGRGGFKVVGLNVQAFQDGTTVQLDLDADGNFELTQTLDEGQQFTRTQGIIGGAQIESSNPVQVHIFTANPASAFEARAYTIVPLEQWTDDYLAPRADDGDFWIYNPDSQNALQVNAQTVTATTVITVPPRSTAKYPATGLSFATGLRLTSTDGRPFNALAALSEVDLQDWGYAVLPVNRLTTQSLTGWGVGNINMPPDNDQSRIYVTAVSATTIFVDYDNDGNPDASFNVAPLAQVDITDPNDHDMTGAFLYTDDGTPFVAVWGQEKDADRRLPSIDVGTGVVPLPSVALQMTASLLADRDCTGTPTQGDLLRYRLRYFNDTVNPVFNAIVDDNLPPTLDYRPNSTQHNGQPVADDSPGNTPFPLDENGFTIATIDTLGSGIITFDAVVNDMPDNIIVNQAGISIEGSSEIFDVSTVFQRKLPPNPPYQVKLRPANVFPEPPVSGENVTFNVTITNTSPSPIATLGLQFGFNPTHLSFLTSAPPPDAGVPGLITWNDLLSNSDLPPASSLTTTATFLVSNITAPLTSTQAITVSGAILNNGTLLPPCVDTAEIALANPTPPPAPTSVPPTATPTPATDDDDDDNNGNNVPPPPPPPEAVASLPGPSPEAEASAAPAPIPVILLPATGQRPSGWLAQGLTHRALPLLPLLALTGFVVWMWLRMKRGS